MSGCNGRLHSVQSFAAVDGPGVRYAIFLQGCGLRCAYCHNPDTWNTAAGETVSASDLLSRALRYKDYWRGGGGITVSGGEPMLQMDFVTELFRLAKENGVHTALDTAAAPYSSPEQVKGLLAVTDLVLLDIKHIDPEKHKLLTGAGNENILAFARHLSEIGKPMWVRHVLVPGVTDAPADLAALGRFIKSLGNAVEKTEILPYHSFGLHKWAALGKKSPLENTPSPTNEQISRARAIIGVD